VTDDIIHDVNEGPRRTGKTRFAEFLAHMGHTYRENLRDIVIMTSSDGVRASAEFTVHGAYLSDDVGLPPAKGQTYRIPAGAFFAIRNGQICRVTTYYNLSDWIAQVSG
jgi:steroid delta-isomerase-like uncharacterized protein